MTVRLAVRAEVDDQALSALHALAFGVPYRAISWRGRLLAHSLTWITAHDESDRLVGFVNVAWDGGTHAFVLDTAVDPRQQHAGVGTALVRQAAREAAIAGCHWLDVDFEDHLSEFYIQPATPSPQTAAAGSMMLPTRVSDGGAAGYLRPP